MVGVSWSCVFHYRRNEPVACLSAFVSCALGVFCVWFAYHFCVFSKRFNELVARLPICFSISIVFFVSLLCAFLHFLRVFCACVSCAVCVSCLRVSAAFCL